MVARREANKDPTQTTSTGGATVAKNTSTTPTKPGEMTGDCTSCIYNADGTFDSYLSFNVDYPNCWWSSTDP